MKKFLVGILILIACSTLLISEDLNSSVGVKKEDIFLKLDTGGHTAMIRDIIVTKLGDIITASHDKTIRIWDSKTGKEKRKILGEIKEGQDGKIYAIALSPNEEFLVVGGFILGSGNDGSRAGAIRIYNYHSGKLIKVLKSHTNTVNDLSFSPDGKFLISGSADKSVKIWDIEKLELYKTIKIHNDVVTAVKIFQKDNEYLSLSTGNDNQLILYNINKKKILKQKTFKKLFYSKIAISDKHIAINGVYKIYIYNYKLDIVDIIHSQTTPNALAYSPNNKFLIAGHHSKPNKDSIYILNKNKYKKLIDFTKYKNTTTAVAFLNNKKVVIAGGNNFKISTFNIYTKVVKPKIEGVGKGVFQVGIKKNKVMWTDKNSYFFEQNKLKVIDPKKLILKKSIDLTNFRILDVKKKTLNALPKRKNSLNLTHTMSTGKYNLAFFRERLFLEQDNVIKLEIAKNNPNRDHISYGFYKDYIISGGSHGHFQIYNLKGQEIANLIGHEGEVRAINTYKNMVVSGSSDQIIKIWDLNQLYKNKKIDYSFLWSEQARLQTRIGRKVSIYEIMNLADKQGINYYLSKKLQPQLSLFISKTNDWIAWTPEGYFNASEKGVDYLYFHLNHGAEYEAEAIPMKKLYDHFFRPDLIKLKLAGEEEAYRKEIDGLDYRKALNNPPPDIKIIEVDDKNSIKNSTVKTNKKSIKLAYNIVENLNRDGESGGIGLIRIYQEGKLIQTIGEGEDKRKIANAYTKLQQDRLNKTQKKRQEEREKLALKGSNSKENIPIETDNKKTQIVTTTSKIGEQSPIEIELKSGKNEIAIEAFNKTNTVASYRDSIIINANIPKRKPKLYAIVAGVNKFERHIDGMKDLRFSENDANAIKEAVEQKMQTVFIGTNGIEIVPLIGKELTKANLYRTIKEISEKAHLEDTVLFYISTHGRSEKKEGGELYLIPQNNGDAEDWLKFKDTFQAIQSIKALNQIFVIDACESGTADDIVSAVYDSKASVLAKSSGVHMLLATTRGTNAFESDDPKVKNGVFTHRILEALRSRGTDLNQDNFISIKEVSTELRKPQSNSEFQYPVIRNMGSDVRLERVE